jgi:exonuclease VII small subunit
LGENEQPSPNADSLYTEEGFELAKEYYERLIVQHPNRKHVPRAIDELTFYPAMFSLWVYEVSEKSKRARKRFEEEHAISDSKLGDTSMMSEDARADASALVASELQQAREIAARLDQLIISPPFDKHLDLLQLRGMVGLWLADLILRGEKRHSNIDWDQILSGEDDVDDEEESTPEKLQRLSETQAELNIALHNFERAQANGRQLGDVLHDVSSRINDISKKRAALGAG